MPINAKDIPDLVHWYRGMLLMPEHFRAATARNEMMAPYLVQSTQPFAWGVRTLDVSLEATTFVLDAIEAILPDGTAVALERARGDAALRYDFEGGEVQIQPGEAIDLYLAIAGWTTGSLDLDRTDTGVPCRYRAFPQPLVPGTESDDDEMELAQRVWLRPELTLIAGTRDRQPRASYTLLRLARIALVDGKPALADYEPPRLRIGEATLLPRRVRAVADEMHSRAAQVQTDIGMFRSATPREQGDDADGDPRTAAERQLHQIASELRAMRTGTDSLRALMRMLPRLRAMLMAGVSHPFEVYLTLCDALGELGLLSATLDLNHLPPYDHNDSLKSFDALIGAIRGALAVFELRYQVMPFIRRSDSAFELRLERGDLANGRSLLIGTVSHRATPREEQRRWLENASIGMDDTRSAIRRRRVAGWQRNVGIGSDAALGLNETPQLLLARIVPDADASDLGGLLVVESDIGEGPTEMNFYRPVARPGGAAGNGATP
ncbi:type VI secretion system baseplate subunit TssK [Sphingomonas sp. 37zxx]|uniref:type VI secretion system baseplate subunit TssK n=1 Tax=Sphingomonas sp. 37zxx TaxID=1550073 RepID=UPI0018CD1982|nr:type VI secretion system baseplate subunit TssK [Sphingomonas sp. 37zxx]